MSSHFEPLQAAHDIYPFINAKEVMCMDMTLYSSLHELSLFDARVMAFMHACHDMFRLRCLSFASIVIRLDRNPCTLQWLSAWRKWWSGKHFHIKGVAAVRTTS